MAEQVVPMIHVSDVRATIDWYKGIGFTVVNTYGNEGDGLSFAILSFGNSRVMFNQGGQPSTRFRREVDLYIYTDGVDDLYQRLKDRVEVVEAPHDKFYGMREFIIRDPNRFWVTFGESSVFDSLMAGVWEGNVDLLRAMLESREITPETLTAALTVALDKKNATMAEMLKKAGALPAADVDLETLQTYAGKYEGEQGFEINVTLKDGKLFAAPGAQEPLSLLAVNRTTFRPIFFDDYGTITFSVEGGKTIGCVLNHGSHETQLKRA
jgi:uncharacterized glyoxalase superfamily protein PhnB